MRVLGPEHLFYGPGFGHPAPHSKGDHIWGSGCPKVSWVGERGMRSSGFLHPDVVMCARSSAQEVFPGPVLWSAVLLVRDAVQICDDCKLETDG